MQKRKVKKILSFSLCLVLIAVMVLGTAGCADSSQTVMKTLEGGTLGEGETSFRFTVVDGEIETVFEIFTNQTTVGGALQELGLIEGEEGPYGLYVKTVNGITYDYEKDGCYWAFYQDGAYATAGVDKTEITSGKTYTLKAER